MIEIFLDLRYPKSKGSNQSSILFTLVPGSSNPYLHCHQSVVDENFLCEEISSDSSLVASTEFFIDLIISEACMLAIIGIRDRPRSAAEQWVGGEVERTYWFIKLVLPTPLSPRMIT